PEVRRHPEPRGLAECYPKRDCALTTFSPHHVFVFLLTFSSYPWLHASRKTFSNVK
ncbi:Hypothetical predicted protein, partial [Marmota monax]